MNKDLSFQIECLTRDVIILMADEFGWDYQRAMDEFYSSETFKMLEDERSGLYYQSPAYVLGVLNQNFRKEYSAESGILEWDGGDDDEFG